MRRTLLLLGLTLNAMTSHAQPYTAVTPLMERYQADNDALQRRYPHDFSARAQVRFGELYQTYQKQLGTLKFDELPRDGQVDYLIFKNTLTHSLKTNALDKVRNQDVLSIVPFGPQMIALDEELRDFQKADGEKSAKMLTDWKAQIDRLPTELKSKQVSSKIAFAALRAIDDARGALHHWHRFYAGYDPTLTWWVQEPYKALDESLTNYRRWVSEEVAHIRENDKTAFPGDPVGRERLMEDLAYEMIDYTPEELIQIGEQEYTWCLKEMEKASSELGYKDWHDALEHVKNLHVQPGEQPWMIRDLALEAIDFMKKNDLVTVPALAEETWRMEMMSPEAQLQNPFFLGGEEIIVSYPTADMSQEAKQMSLRGNNVHFARATVQHELIPGHHLQQFYESRYRTYRGPYGTPFWTEGWALYWEMMLWDKGFPKTPENRIGMLFWRMHRCARIVFSLKFHLGQMTAPECVDYLVQKVGHERKNAEAEVRRSFAGNYPPLYQLAYMIGALQIKQLRHEVVDTGKMKEKDFHDAILMNNNMPIALLRAALKSDEKLTPEYRAHWKFYTLK